MTKRISKETRLCKSQAGIYFHGIATSSANMIGPVATRLSQCLGLEQHALVSKLREVRNA